MINQTDDTYHALINSFKELLLKISFEKITIKKITDGAGVIRPTFYNYFRDKYAIFEEILDDELFDSMYKLVDLKMLDEAVAMLFNYFDQNKAFYHQAFKVSGQNSFSKIFHTRVEELFLYILELFPLKEKDSVIALSRQGIAHYYTIGIIDVIKNWCDYSDDDLVVENVIKAYQYIVSHALTDIFDMEDN